MDNKIRLDRIEDAIEDFRNGKMVIVVDDEDRENEGDLIMAAEKITPEDEERPRRAVRAHHSGALPRTATGEAGGGQHLDARHSVYRDR